MALCPINVAEISHIIKNLKNSTSIGVDNIPISVMKFASSFISLSLFNLINCSFTHGVFPAALKVAKVIPVHKSGSYSQNSNYRPISILNSFSKVYEKAMTSRLSNYLTSVNFFYDNQFGFKPNHSTDMALLSLHYYVTASIDKKNSY